MVSVIVLAVLFVSVVSPSAWASQDIDWWEDASFYQIYPRSWKDSKGNGIGDLKGITEKLDYLRELGMTATWLSPIFESPMVDNGYDITNFTKIDPLFGTLEDFDALLKKAKAIGVKVILDFVPNHSSDQCEWFKKSVNREDGFDNFYVWADGKDDPEHPGKKLPPSNWKSIFGGSMWEWNEKRQQFYLHQFYKEQPDFDFRNPKVHAVLLDVLKFWLDRGVDGFRIDAVPHMYEKQFENGTFPDEERNYVFNDPNSKDYFQRKHSQEQYETVELLYEWREFLDDYKRKNGGDTRVLLAEAYVTMNSTRLYFGNGTHFGSHLPFNNNILRVAENTNARQFEKSVKSWTEVMWTTHKTANWVNGNHDQPRLKTRVGSNKDVMMNIVAASLPGATITYYGEEIGMENTPTDCVDCPLEDGGEKRKNSRSPFQWNDEVSAGFSTNLTTWLPVSANYKEVNVKLQRGVARSTLNVFKDIHRFKHTPAFKEFKNEGGFSYGAINDNVFQIIRGEKMGQYRILANFGGKIERVGREVFGKDHDAERLFEYVLVTSHSHHSVGERVKLENVKLMPYETVVLQKINKKY